MFDIIGIIFTASLIFGIAVNFIGIPGNAVISFNSFIYAIIKGFDEISWSFLILIIGMAVLIEFLEYLSISFASYKMGASRKAVWGAVIGGFAGAISGFFVTPVLGSVIGSMTGVFIGAVGLEWMAKRKISVALKAGAGAFLGKIGSLTIKMIGSVVMATTILYHIMG